MIDDPTVKFVRDLDEILDLSTRLLTQAIHDAGATIDGTSLPGGRAMIALANVGDQDSFERRQDLAEAAWMNELDRRGRVVRLSDGRAVALDQDDRPDLTVDEDDDTAPALQVIRYWSERYRWELNSVWDHVPTIATEAGFLRNADVLAHVATHHAGDWPRMADDINHARQHLETVLHAGRRPDRSRVVCDNDACEDPKRLIRVYGRRYVVAWQCVACSQTLLEHRACSRCHRRASVSSDDTCRRQVGPKDDRTECGGRLESTVVFDRCPNVWCGTTAPAAPIYASNPDDDRWKCTSCKTRYDDEAFMKAYARMLLTEGADRYVRLADAIDTLKYAGRSGNTVRSWLKSPLEHVGDRCTVCQRQWPPSEHNACPALVAVDDPQLTDDLCGGDLAAVYKGDRDDVVDSFCELGSHRVWVWWPDLRVRHRNTKKRNRARA